MRFAARNTRNAALAALAVLALLGVSPDPDNVAPGAAAGPQIIDIVFAPEHLKAGANFDVTIHTTPDITSLQAHVMKYKLPVPRTGDGVFSATAKVPWWARIYHGTFHVVFVGVDAAGSEAQMEADVRI